MSARSRRHVFGGRPRRVDPQLGPAARVNAPLDRVACTSATSRSSPHAAPSTREERAPIHVLSSTCPSPPSRSPSSPYRMTSPVAALPSPCTPAERVSQHARRESSRASSDRQLPHRSPMHPLRRSERLRPPDRGEAEVRFWDARNKTGIHPSHSAIAAARPFLGRYVPPSSDHRRRPTRHLSLH